MNTTGEPLVSIIIPCYNYGNFLLGTLTNVLSQSYTNWECIVVDDGSTDNTKEVGHAFEREDVRIRYVFQKNMGLSAARNTGLQNSYGKYVQFLDADDLIHPDKVAMQVQYLEEHTTVDVVYGNAIYFNEEDTNALFQQSTVPNHTLPIVSGSGEVILKQLTDNNFIVVSSPLVRRSLINKVGLFDTAYRSYEDWQYWFRSAIAEACFQYIDRHGTETYIRQGHVSMMSNKMKLTEAGIRLREYMRTYLSGSLKIYNQYRLLKLRARKLTLQKKR